MFDRGKVGCDKLEKKGKDWVEKVRRVDRKRREGAREKVGELK